MNTLTNSVATLPITDIMLPSADWKMMSYKEHKTFSEETICFEAKMKHLPSGKSFAVRNDGHGGSNFYEATGKDTYKAYQELLNVWSKFVSECAPALRASVANSPEEWIRDLYNDHEFAGEGFNEMNSDSVVSLFVEEMNNQAILGRKRGLVVRTPESRESFAIYSNSTPASLAGKVVGEYWNKTEKTWTAL